MLADAGIAFACCENIYQAMALTATSGLQITFFVSRLESLEAENGKFIEKLASYQIPCYCIAQQRNGHINAELLTKIVLAGGRIMFDVAELSKTVEEVADKFESKVRKNQSSLLIKDGLLTTKAELDALLGV